MKNTIFLIALFFVANIQAQEENNQNKNLFAEKLSKNEKHAFGLKTSSLLSERYTAMSYSGSYAKLFKLKNSAELRIGSQINFSRKSFIYNSDNEVQTSRMQESTALFGVAYKSNNTRIGLSAEMPIYFKGEDFTPTEFNFSFSGSHNFSVGKNFNIVPHASLYLTKNSFNNTILGIDELAVDFIYKKKYFLRLGQTSTNSLSLEVNRNVPSE